MKLFKKTIPQVFSSIKVKLYAIMIILILICITFFTASITSQVFQALTNHEQESYQTIAVLADRIVTNMESIEEITKFPLQVTSSQDHFLITAMDDDLLTNVIIGLQFADIAKMYINQNSMIEMMAVYDINGEGMYTNDTQSSYHLSTIDPTDDWVQRVIAERGGVCFIQADEFVASSLNADQDLFCVARALIDVSTMEAYGIIVIGVWTSDIQLVFDNSCQYDEQDFAIYYQGAQLFGSIVEPLDTLDISDGEFTTIYETAFPYEINIYLQNTDGWTFRIKSSLDIVLTHVTLVNIPVLIVLFMLLSSVVLIIIHIIKSILIPLQSLVDIFDNTKGDHFQTIYQENLPKELEQLFSSYNEMTARIDLLVNEVLRKSLSEREMELQLLRTQINPHYLYNTLECMHMQAYSNQDYTVSNMAELLGQNLQYGLRNTNQEVAMRQELHKTMEYVQLITYHYGDQLHVNTHIDEEILDCKTIKLLFQPLIENAVMHGRKQNCALHIEIMGYQLDDSIQLIVSDDGKGIPAEKLKHILCSLENSSHDHTAIGLYNVQRRIQLFYGNQYGMQINSIADQGTHITITLPYHK